MKNDLPAIFAEYLNSLQEDSKATVDDFFEYANIPVRYRTDFAFACILKQAKERGLL